MLTHTSKPFDSKEFIFELKYDGYRALCYLKKGSVRLLSRRRIFLEERYPELADLHRHIKAKNAIIDGEIVAFDKDGKPNFNILQNRRDISSQSQIAYVVFDILLKDDKDLTSKSLLER